MSRYSGSKTGGAGGSSQVWAGIFVGMVIGAGMAAVLTWYMMKLPSPFVHKAQPVMAPQPSTALPAAAAPQQGNEKPRFEFYNVLAEKSPKPPAPVKPAQGSQTAQPKPVEQKPAANYAPQILQVGSFSTSVDAEKLKAKLALIGAESHIQTANIPDKGVYYRVRLGPYRSEEELNRARNFLKQNDLDGTPMRAQ
ncbi:MAG TPA: SPOR domain-containing protein [Gallionella sp.]